LGDRLFSTVQRHKICVTPPFMRRCSKSQLREFAH